MVPWGWGERGAQLGNPGSSFPRDTGRLERRVAVRVPLLGIIFHANHILHRTHLGFSFPKLLTQSAENTFIILASPSKDESFGPFIPRRRPVAEPGELMLCRGYHW